MLDKRRAGSYRNWDDVAFRKSWAKNPSAVVPESTGKAAPLLILDEIHKERTWKSRLKGVYDTLEAPCDILVTGSARLNVYRRGGDSLLGRYMHFRLHPFSLRELDRPTSYSPDETYERIFARSMRPRSEDREHLDALMEFGPFPEPVLAQSARRARIWRRARTEAIIREDLRDLSRIPDLGRVEMMAALLPERVGSLFSKNALREELEVSFDTVKRWLDYMKELYYVFEVKPYHRRLPRALKKEGKVYLWDFAEVADKAARFENLVACHLLKACDYWTDTGDGDFELRYLRNKEKKEIDFLIVRDGAPWLPIEVKLSRTELSPSWGTYSGLLPCENGIQIIREPHWQTHSSGNSAVLVAGAAEVLRYFP